MIIKKQKCHGEGMIMESSGTREASTTITIAKGSRISSSGQTRVLKVLLLSSI
jgi:hypothetical protein